MESTSFAMSVQCSQFVVDRIRERNLTPDFEFEQYGVREVKGKGQMTTYLVKAGEWRAAMDARDDPPTASANDIMKETFQRVKFTRQGSTLKAVAHADFIAQETVEELKKGKAAAERQLSAAQSRADELAREKDEKAALLARALEDVEKYKEASREVEQLREQAKAAKGRASLVSSPVLPRTPITPASASSVASVAGIPHAFSGSEFVEQIERTQPSTWSDAAVLAWLHCAFTSSFASKYAAAFEEGGINGMILLSLTDEDLTDLLGITRPLHKRRFRGEIEKLVERNENWSEIVESSRNDVARTLLATTPEL